MVLHKIYPKVNRPQQQSLQTVDYLRLLILVLDVVQLFSNAKRLNQHQVQIHHHPSPKLLQVRCFDHARICRPFNSDILFGS